MKNFYSLKKTIIKYSFIIMIALFCSPNIFSQNIAITDDNLYNADPSAMLDVKSTTKGLLIPRLTTTQREDIDPAALGLLVFDITEKAFYYYDGSEWVNLSKGQLWSLNSNYVLLSDTTARVGIGTLTPNSKLEVKADASFTSGDTLFAVKDKDGNIVFAVFPDGAKVYVNESAKGTVGGFAVSGRSPTKATEEDFLKVTPDSTRVWIREDAAKGSVGGFAVSGRSPTKGVVNDYFISTADSTRIYVNDSVSTKGTVGGFAVSGRSPTKGTLNDYFIATLDSTRIYVNDSIPTKGTVGGFAVSGRSPTKGLSGNYMEVTRDSTRIYVTETAKGGVGGFAVSGRSPTKSLPTDYFNISGNTAAETINNESRVMWYPQKAALLAGEIHVGSEDSVGTNSVALGYRAISMGDYSQAMGYQAKAFGNNSTAIGNNANTIGINSYAFGNNTKTTSEGAFAFGIGAEAQGKNSFAFGGPGSGLDYSQPFPYPTINFDAPKAIGDYSYAFGMGSIASATGAFSMGTLDTASADYSIAMGYKAIANGQSSVSLGYQSTSSGWASFATGRDVSAIGDHSIAMGLNASAEGEYSIAIGRRTEAIGSGSTAMGYFTNATGNNSTAIGDHTSAEGLRSTAMGYNSYAIGDYSTAIGHSSNANGDYSTALGYDATTNASYTFAVGWSSSADKLHSIALGNSTTANGTASIAIGYNTSTSGTYSTAMGNTTIAGGISSTAMGDNTTASGDYSTAMGNTITVSGSNSFGIGLDATSYTILNNNTMAIMGGNVGIGVAAPTYTLDVAGDIRTSNKIYASANGASYFRGGDDAELWDVNVLNTLAIYGVANSAVATLRLGSGGADISGSAGNIGIGTISPTAKFDVIASGSKTSNYDGLSFSNTATSSIASIVKTGLSISSTGTWNGASAINRGLYVNVSGGTNNYAAVFSGGRVGIGTTSPWLDFHVSGNSVFVGNVGLGVTYFGNGTQVLAIENGTAPNASSSNSVLLYAKNNLSARSELMVRDEQGNITTLSPHNFDNIQKSEPMAWSFHSENADVGQRIDVDMLKAIRLVENMSGEKLVYISELEGNNSVENNIKNESLVEMVKKQQELIDELLIQDEENSELKNKIESLEKTNEDLLKRLKLIEEKLNKN